ncbi:MULTISPECIES: S8 family serine peptidase [Pseudothermotoga]|jgi:hypothetical protein|uniref:Peptidase S8 and S53 subtilisin kexin sedolisin n=2 Tax=Thermotogaceae TaxID=188709 RepID=A8F8V7_PSELT|nr:MULTISPECIES: S8 family serine peptidase [Pseudothermotoga]ABV34591.1 peptidase S8 and S53 subtilisin kexin sedolisin [Pseudothermotoga lettingae TMO]
MMKRLIIVLFLSVILLLAGCMNNSVQNSQQPEGIVAAIDKGAEVMSNVVIVGYKDEYKQDIVNLIKSIDENATVRVDFKLDQTNVISFSTSIDYSTMREKIISKLKADESLKEKINYVEPSYKRYLIEPITNDNLKDTELLTKTKQIYADQQEEFFEKYMWGIRKVKAPEAWQMGYTGEGVIVAVVDTGVDGTHPDLQGQLVEGYRPLTGETLPAASDSSFGGAHGTHVAGTIAASDNSIGVIGVAPNAKIMPIVIFDTGSPETGGDGSYIGDDYVAQGFMWAFENGAMIFSNSWGGKGYSITLAHTIAQIMSYGGIFVASAGNSHTDEIHYPSCYPGVINVAASTAQDGITNFSTRGRWVTVAAPGDFTILSTVPLWDTYEFFDQENPYALYGGTSMATPHVSGVIALLLEKLGSTEATPYQIRKHIAATADDIMAPGFDHDSGWGRVNAEMALTQDLPSDEGANVYFEFYVDTDPASYVYVTLYPQDDTIPVYYGKSDENGSLPIVGIEPGVYDVYMAYGDAAYLGISTSEQLTYHESITIENGDNPYVHVFESGM